MTTLTSFACEIRCWSTLVLSTRVVLEGTRYGRPSHLVNIQRLPRKICASILKREAVSLAMLCVRVDVDTFANIMM